MDVKQAVDLAKVYIGELFAEEDISDVLLEEVVFEELPEEWRITIGFDRPVPAGRAEHPILGPLTARRGRVYKVVTIRNSDRSVMSVIDRALPEAS